MAKPIRKISIGIDYKNEAMHYSVGQQTLDYTKAASQLAEAVARLKTIQKLRKKQ